MRLKLPKGEYTSSSWGGSWENERGITPFFPHSSHSHIEQSLHFSSLEKLELISLLAMECKSNQEASFNGKLIIIIIISYYTIILC